MKIDTYTTLHKTPPFSKNQILNRLINFNLETIHHILSIKINKYNKIRNL